MSTVTESFYLLVLHIGSSCHKQIRVCNKFDMKVTEIYEHAKLYVAYCWVLNIYYDCSR